MSEVGIVTLTQVGESRISSGQPRPCSKATPLQAVNIWLTRQIAHSGIYSSVAMVLSDALYQFAIANWVKVKVRTLDIAPLRESSPQKRSGMARVLKGSNSLRAHPELDVGPIFFTQPNPRYWHKDPTQPTHNIHTWNANTGTVEPVFFTCPLFSEFLEHVSLSKMKGTHCTLNSSPKPAQLCFVGTLRSHYSRYLQIFLAHNTITNTKCNEKITLLLIHNPTQPNPWMDPTHVHLWNSPYFPARTTRDCLEATHNRPEGRSISKNPLRCWFISVY